jgi:hypothetical protein
MLIDVYLHIISFCPVTFQGVLYSDTLTLHWEMSSKLALTCRAGLCRRRGWRDPLYETYRSSSGFTCLVLVNGREYQTDLAYESDGLAQENAAMRAFMVCRNFSVNGGMLARNGVVQGLPASESRHHRKSRGGRSHSQNLSSSSSTSSE